LAPYYALSFFETDGGRITRSREDWIEESYEKPQLARDCASSLCALAAVTPAASVRECHPTGMGR
jgi:hypothetical protein